MRSTKIIKICSSSLCTCLHHMVILRTQNKITDFLMILAWASPFKCIISQFYLRLHIMSICIRLELSSDFSNRLLNIIKKIACGLKPYFLYGPRPYIDAHLFDTYTTIATTCVLRIASNPGGTVESKQSDLIPHKD